jgi:hydrogenase maturation protease
MLLRLKEELLEYTKSVNEGCPKITVLGIGNLLLKDEGVGVHLVQKLTGILDDANVDIIDAGTYPDFPALVNDSTDKLIIIDAVKAGDKPGTIYRFNFDNVDPDSALPVSLHDIGVADSLKIMALLNRQPKSIVVIGIEPKTIDFGLELSPEVEDKLPEVIKLVLKEIAETTINLKTPSPGGRELEGGGTHKVSPSPCLSRQGRGISHTELCGNHNIGTEVRL